LHTYHDARNAFPALTCGPPANLTFSYNPPLLPYVEQTALYEQWITHILDPSYSGPDAYPGNPATGPQYAYKGGVISVFSCPSDGNATQPLWFSGHIPSSYAGCLGDTYYHAFHWSGFYFDNKRGLFGAAYKWRTFAAISDGTSNSLAFSENVVATAMLTDRRIKATRFSAGANGTMANWTTLGKPSGGWTPNDCLATRAPNSKDYIAGQTSDYPNGLFWYGHNMSNGFHTILPPNSPSCYEGTVGTTGFNLRSATSEHTGGVQAAFIDGSVTFISETIDCGTLTQFPAGADSVYPAGVSGQSPNGTWGALGSINGGESKSL